MSVQPFVRSIFQGLNTSFTLSHTDVSFEKVVNRKVGTSSVLPADVIEFTVPGSKAPYVYLTRDIMFEFEVTLTAANKGRLQGSLPDVTVVNNLMHSLFCNFEMQLNGRTIGLDFNYMYKAYAFNLLSYDNLCKNSHLRSEGWYSDTVDEFQSVELNGG